MGGAFADASKGAAAIWQEADEALGFSLSRLCREGPEGELLLTANTQPAVLTATVAAAAVLAEHGITPDLAAGHSLGEYSALVLAGALSFRDAVQLVRKRGEFMQEAVPVGTGAMAALMGVELAAAEAACVEASGSEVVGVANINAPGQIVIAGHRTAVERAVKAVAARGGRRSVMLPVSAPFHSSLLTPAADRLARYLENVAFSAPRIPVVNNVDVASVNEPQAIKEALARQACSPVRWVEVVRAFSRAGVSDIAECGPGKVLAGLMRRIEPGLRGYAIAEPQSLAQAMEALK